VQLDILFLADLRFPGGTSTALINEVTAAKQAGLRVAICPVQSSVLISRRPPNPDVLALISKLGVQLLSAGRDIRTRLALIYHPTLFNQPSLRKISILAAKVAMVAHHPLTDPLGRLQFQFENFLNVVRHEFDREPIVLPVGPVVRDSFAGNGYSDTLWHNNWHNLIDTEAWPQLDLRPRIDRMVIGRHSRPDLLKWPDEDGARLVYPNSAEFSFRMLGVDEKIMTAFAPWASNWQARPFARGAVQSFLRQLDAYSYFHHDHWSEAFGYNILEALASGLPTVLPPHFKPLFGDAAIYAEPADAVKAYQHLRQAPAARIKQGAKARKCVEDRFGLDQYARRYAELVGDVKTETAAPRHVFRALNPTRVMTITSNGVGVGHLSRQLAIAKSQPPDVETNFFSLSKAVTFAQEAGFCAEYRPYHRQLGVDPKSWNRWFYQEVLEALVFYRPDTVVFDGNVPYRGLLDALDRHPHIARVWVRRSMWRHRDKKTAGRAKKFHLVISPGEICAAADPRNDSADDPWSVAVPTILPVPVDELLGRNAARRLLNLPADAEIALLQLGAGANFDMNPAREMALETLLSDPDRHVVEILSPARTDSVAPVHPHHHLRTIYPVFQFQKAFDFTISAAGYNSFHEIIAGAIPCLFVPNTASEMDLQEVRADYAQRAGWALSARVNDPFSLRRGLDRLTADPELRAQLTARMRTIDHDWGGAQDAARLISLIAKTQPVVLS
jgi:hypothetical protein